MSDSLAVTALWFDTPRRPIIIDNFASDDLLPIFLRATKYLDAYFAGKRPPMHVTLNPTGSEFRKSVWKAMMEIPYGHTATYKDIAEILESTTGKKSSPQAVGIAISHNPINILIPSHRILSSANALVGYQAGVDTKQKLLDLEKGRWKAAPHKG